MIMHQLIKGQSTAENILSTLRPDRTFTHDEAKLLDLMLMLHAEHGGGNNSTFACRVLTSSSTDPYSAYAAAIGSLKGARHGGANHKVAEMHAYIKENVSDWEDNAEVSDYLRKILKKEAGDGSGLIYGMGHAVYTLSDPRAVILKKYAGAMAEGTEYEREFRLLESIERLTPIVFEDMILKAPCSHRCLRCHEWRAGAHIALKKSTAASVLSVPHTSRSLARKSISLLKKDSILSMKCGKILDKLLTMR